MQNRRNAIYILLSASLLTGLFTGRAFFFNMVYVLGGLILVSLIWSWLSVRWISIGRRTRSRRARVGHALEETFQVRNRSLFPKLWLEIRDHSDLPNHHASHVIPALGLRSRHRWQVQTICQARGEFRLGPMMLISGDPFGFFLSQRQIAAISHVIVYPATVQINRFGLPVGSLSGGEAQRRRTHYITTNASGVRDYVPGDSFNRIHWRTTARKGRLVVKEFEIDPLVDIWLFADFSSQSLFESPDVQRLNGVGPVIPKDGKLPASTEEYVAVASASLCRYFIELERSVGFATYAPNRVVHQPERGNRQLTRIFESLAVARSLSNYSLGQMMVLETPYLARGTTLLIVTASADKEWIHEAQILSRRGIRVTCILVDAGTFGANTSLDEIQGILQLARIPTIIIRHGEDIGVAIARHAV